MSPITATRQAEISSAIDAIRANLSKGVSVETLNRAKAELMALAMRADLFSFEAYPLPTDDKPDNTYLIHCDDDGAYALYVNAGLPEQSYPPHDHGGAWAIVAGVTGKERHGVYVRNGETATAAGQVLGEPGTAISMLPDGIHSINAEGPDALLHLHLYATTFETQGIRSQYDLESGSRRQFKFEDTETILDARGR